MFLPRLISAGFFSGVTAKEVPGSSGKGCATTTVRVLCLHSCRCRILFRPAFIRGHLAHVFRSTAMIPAAPPHHYFAEVSA
jgi:hypothetical protein